MPWQCHDSRAGSRWAENEAQGSGGVVTGAGRNIGEEIAQTVRRRGRQGRGSSIWTGRAANGSSPRSGEPRGGRTVHRRCLERRRRRRRRRCGRRALRPYRRFWVNNVAISDNKHIFDISEEEWDRVLAVTLQEPIPVGKHVGLQMAKQGTGGASSISVQPRASWAEAAVPIPPRRAALRI